MATQAQRLTALEDGMAQILAALQGNTAQPTPEEERPTPKDKVAQTTQRAKSAGTYGKMDPEDISDDDGGVRITPSGKEGVFRQGSRVKVLRNGKTAVGSLSVAEARWIADHIDDIEAAAQTVDKRAKVGSFLPKVTS